MQDSNENGENKGVVDGISLLYIAAGIPAIFLFIVVRAHAAAEVAVVTHSTIPSSLISHLFPCS